MQMVGIALMQHDARVLDAERLGHDLGQHRAVALAARLGAGVDVDAAVGARHHPGGLGNAAAGEVFKQFRQHRHDNADADHIQQNGHQDAGEGQA